MTTIVNLDRETRPTYTLTVTVTDPTSLVSERIYNNEIVDRLSAMKLIVFN